MSERKKELISALLDDELASSEQQELDDFIHDEELAAFYHRQSLVKNALSGQASVELPVDFTVQLQQKLAEQPVVMAPGNIKTTSWLKEKQQAVTGFAIAASVAMVSFVVMQNQNPSSELAPLGLASSSVQPVHIQPASQEQYSLVTDRQVITAEQLLSGQQNIHNEAYRKLLNQYLSTHTESSTLGNVQGIMPYSKIVGYEE